MNIIERIEQDVIEGKVSKIYLIAFLKLLIKQLNLKTRTQFAKDHKKSYLGVRDWCKDYDRIDICGKEFIIDND